MVAKPGSMPKMRMLSSRFTFFLSITNLTAIRNSKKRARPPRGQARRQQNPVICDSPHRMGIVTSSSAVVVQESWVSSHTSPAVSPAKAASAPSRHRR